MFAGCADYQEMRAPTLARVQTVAIGEFTGSDAGIAGLLQQSVEKELSLAGYAIVKTTDNPDAIVSGSVQTIEATWAHRAESHWIVSAKQTDSKIIASVNCEGYYSMPGEYIAEISKRLVKNLK